MASTITINKYPTRLVQDHAIHIWMRRQHSDPWTKIPPETYIPGDLQLGTGRGDRSNRDDTFTFTMVLGDCRYPNTPSYQHTVPKDDIDGYWVKVAWKIPPEELQWYRTLGADSQMIQDGETWWYCPFVGQIRMDSKKVAGNSVDQTFMVYGGLQYLEGCAVSGFFHESTENMLWWNMEPNNWNRSQNVIPVNPGDAEGSYRFGKGGSWAIRYFMDYIVAYFVNVDPYTKSREGRVQFSISAAPEMLLFLQLSPINIKPEASDTVMSLIRRIHQSDAGLDFYIRPKFGLSSEEASIKDFLGYEIVIFSLVGKPKDGQPWIESAVPPNNDKIIIDKRDSHSIYNVQKTKSQIRRFYRYRIIGEKVRCIGTFLLKNIPDAQQRLLVKQWRDAIEAEYASGPPPAEKDEAKELTDREEAIDESERFKTFRSQEKFEDVFTKFAIDPNTFDPSFFLMAPTFNNEGKLTGAMNGAYQFQEVKTLEEMIIGENKGNLSWKKMPPTAWHLEDLTFFTINPINISNVDDLGISVKPLEGELGIRLKSDPKHHIAKTGNGPEITIPGQGKKPEYSYENIAVTMAWETDTRISLALTDESISPNAGEMCVYAPGCECWYVAPRTFLGELNEQGVAIITPEEQTEGDPDAFAGKIVRNDVEHMKEVLNGIFLKHVYQSRCDVTLINLWPVAHFIGRFTEKVVNSMNGQTTEEPIESVITSIRFSFGKTRSVTLEMGYANRHGARKRKRLKK